MLRLYADHTRQSYGGNGCNAKAVKLLGNGQAEAAVVGLSPAVPGGVRRPHTGFYREFKKGGENL